MSATQHLAVDGGTLAFEVAGAQHPVTADRPLLVLAHGMGDDRRAFAALVPLLVAAGHRVATVDLRGCGGSSTGWPEWSRTAIAGDLLAVTEHLLGATDSATGSAGSGARAVLVGHSIAGGAATVAAATAPHLVAAVVELAPFTRAQSVSLRDLADGPYRRGATQLALTALLGSRRAWARYLDLAHPATAHGGRPDGYAERVAGITAKLAEPGRMGALRGMFRSSPADAGAQLAHLSRPLLVVEGSADCDWSDARAEGERVLADLPAGPAADLSRLAVVDGSGHYPHVQHPEQVAALVLGFLADVRAAGVAAGVAAGAAADAGGR